MTFPFALLNLRFGFKVAPEFSDLGVYGAWPDKFQHTKVVFNPPFESDAVQVFLTPTNEMPPNKPPPTMHQAAVIGVAHQVNRDGFELYAKTTDCGAGYSSFNWLAIQRTPLVPQQQQQPTLEIRMARVQPLHADNQAFPLALASDCVSGDTAEWPIIPYSRPLNDAKNHPLSPIVFVTQSSLSYAFHCLLLPILKAPYVLSPMAACVGMLKATSNIQIRLSARNFDLNPGIPGYNYVALARSPEPTSQSHITDLRVQSGDTFHQLNPGGQAGDWGGAPVYFDSPFQAPPIVLMTAQSRDVQAPPDLRIFHGIAHNVDQYGFTASVRNADQQAGSMMMNWIAFGCGEACGG